MSRGHTGNLKGLKGQHPHEGVGHGGIGQGSAHRRLGMIETSGEPGEVPGMPEPVGDVDMSAGVPPGVGAGRMPPKGRMLPVPARRGSTRR